MNIFKRLFKRKSDEEAIRELNEKLAIQWQKEQEEINDIEVIDEEVVSSCPHYRRYGGYCLECGGKI